MKKKLILMPLMILSFVFLVGFCLPIQNNPFQNLLGVQLYSTTYTVRFVDVDGAIVHTQYISAGEDADGDAAKEDLPSLQGRTFVRWNQPLTSIDRDLVCTPIYENSIWTVTFLVDGNPYDEQLVLDGDSAIDPLLPEVLGKTFLQWDRDYSNITEDLTVTAQFAESPIYTYRATNGGYIITGITDVSITEFTVPKMINGVPVTQIGDNAFVGCKLLTKVTLSDNVLSIGANAFTSCVSLEEIVFSQNLISIGSQAFMGTNLEEIKLPDSLKTIGTEAFRRVGLTEVKIPESVTHLGVLAFSECSSLLKVYLPNSLERISEGAFQGCMNLTTVMTYSGSDEPTDSVLPSELIFLGDSAFKECLKLESKLIIPDTIRYIGAYAFATCVSLTGGITLPEELTEIGRFAFSFCISLTTLELHDKLMVINDGAFWGSKELEGEIKFSEEATVLGFAAFSRLEKATGNITIPTSITVIRDSLFFNCRKLESITFHDGITLFEECAFTDVQNATGTVKYSEKGLTKIANRAFENCRRMVITLDFSKLEQDIIIERDAFRRSGTVQIVDLSRVSRIDYQAFSGTIIQTGNGILVLTGNLVHVGRDAFANSGVTIDVSGLSSAIVNAFEENWSRDTVAVIPPSP